MWSCGFSITLDIEPARSSYLPVLVGVYAGMALTALAMSGLPPGWLMGLMILAGVEGFRLVRSFGPRGTRGVHQLRLAPDGLCWAAFGAGELVPVGLRCGWVWPAVAVGLELKPASGITRPVILFRDQMDTLRWRRLLVRCRQANPVVLT